MPSQWSLSTKPSWTQVALAVLIMVDTAIRFMNGTEISWGWFSVGAVVFALVVGPGLESSAGQQLEAWIKNAGVVAGLSVMIVGLVIVGIAVLVLPMARTPMYSIATGLLLTGAVQIALRLLISSLPSTVRAKSR